MRNTLLLLKYSRSRQLLEKLREILELIRRALPAARFEEWIKAIEVYIMTVNKNIDHEQYKQTLASILPTQFESGSLADRLLIQGREEGQKIGELSGLKKGREEGREAGREEGREEGELVGRILLLEELLGFPETDKSHLLATDMETLRKRVNALQAELRQRNS